MVTLFLLSVNTPMKMSFVNTLRIKVKMASTSNCIRKSSKICNLPCFNKRAKRAVIPRPRFCAEGVKSFAFSETACCGDFYFQASRWCHLLWICANAITFPQSSQRGIQPRLRSQFECPGQTRRNRA